MKGPSVRRSTQLLLLIIAWALGLNGALILAYILAEWTLKELRLPAVPIITAPIIGGLFAYGTLKFLDRYLDAHPRTRTAFIGLIWIVYMLYLLAIGYALLPQLRIMIRS